MARTTQQDTRFHKDHRLPPKTRWRALCAVGSTRCRPRTGDRHTRGQPTDWVYFLCFRPIHRHRQHRTCFCLPSGTRTGNRGHFIEPRHRATARPVLFSRECSHPGHQYRCPTDLRASRIPYRENISLVSLLEKLSTPWRSRFPSTAAICKVEKSSWFKPRFPAGKSPAIRPLLANASLCFRKSSIWSGACPPRLAPTPWKCRRFYWKSGQTTR